MSDKNEWCREPPYAFLVAPGSLLSGALLHEPSTTLLPHHHTPLPPLFHSRTPLPTIQYCAGKFNCAQHRNYWCPSDPLSYSPRMRRPHPYPHDRSRRVVCNLHTRICLLQWSQMHDNSLLDFFVVGSNKYELREGSY